MFFTSLPGRWFGLFRLYVESTALWLTMAVLAIVGGPYVIMQVHGYYYAEPTFFSKYVLFFYFGAMLFSVYKNEKLKGGYKEFLVATDDPRYTHAVRIIAELSRKAGFKNPPKLIVMSDNNAYAMRSFRLGRKIILSNNMMNWPEELLRGIIAHEMAHLKHRDLLALLMTVAMRDALVIIPAFAVSRAVFLAVLWMLTSWVETNDIIFLVVLSLAMVGLTGVHTLLFNARSRRKEHLADMAAVAMMGGKPEHAQHMADALSQVADAMGQYQLALDQSMSWNWISTHPTLRERVRVLGAEIRHPSEVAKRYRRRTLNGYRQGRDWFVDRLMRLRLRLALFAGRTE